MKKVKKVNNNKFEGYGKYLVKLIKIKLIHKI